MDDELKLLVEIAAGLLASGHYTAGSEIEEPRVKHWDAGKDWKKETVEKHRFNYHVVDDACLLLERLKEALVFDQKKIEPKGGLTFSGSA